MMKIISYCLLFSLFFSCRPVDINTKSPQNDGIAEAMWQEFRMTRDPVLNIIPSERLNTARSYMESLAGGTNFPGRYAAVSWQERGPSNIGGRTRAIIIDKRDPSGNTVIAGSVSGGLFRSTNFTTASPSWSPLNDFLPNLAVTALVQDPVHPDTVFAGTGEGWLNIDAVRGGGIFKSTNGGNTWTLLPSTSGFEYIQDLAIDNNGNLLATLRNLVSTNRGVMRSTDRGTSWVQVLGAPLPGFATGRGADLEVSANGDIYASLGIFGRSVVMKSAFATNGANTGALGTWVDITPATPTITQRTEIVLAPSDPLRVYLLMQDSATSQVINIFRSINAGSSWTTLAAPNALNNGANSQTWYNLIGAVDPANPNNLVVGGLNLAKSTDGGDSWTTITSSGSVHVDHHMLVFNGSTNIIDGNDGGIYFSSNIISATPTFLNKNNGFNVTQFYGCDLHPTITDYFLAGAQDNNTQKFVLPGLSSTSAVTGGDGGIPHIDQTDGQLQISSNTSNNYYRSVNGGFSFSSLGASINNDRGQFINPTDLSDPQKILYAGDDAGSYYCIQNLLGTPSAFVVPVAAMGNREVTAVRVDPFSTSTVWLGCSFGNPAAIPVVIKLSGANTLSPSIVAASTLGAPAGSAISCIDVDPANANHILVTLSSYGIPSVFESTNGGASYIIIEGNLPDMPVRWGMFAPANAQLNGSGGGNGGILLGTELGVWTTSVINGSSTVWIPNNSGLANVRTDMLKYRISDNTVVAATHGRGLFTTVLPTVVTGFNDPSNTKDFIKYIHAGHDQLLIVTGTLQTRNMTIQVFNMNGQEVLRSAGRYQNTSLPFYSMPSGNYVLKCTGDRRENFTQKFQKQ